LYISKISHALCLSKLNAPFGAKEGRKKADKRWVETKLAERGKGEKGMVKRKKGIQNGKVKTGRIE